MSTLADPSRSGIQTDPSNRAAALVFEVIGTPAPQGSKRAYVRGARAVLVESSAKVAPWRDSVAHAARAAADVAGWLPVDGPITVDVVCRLKRPESIPKRRTLPDRKPDGDKLLRAVLDALTDSGVIVDDARAVDLSIRKRYAEPGQPSGAAVTITQGATL